ncbi:hypothetical protein FK85_03065 [Halorubrum saccharovorum]|uniref:Uncharacterized protein n=1 Tax=Halorubrum saccharovorum TaxID=2248 RepID=A0A081EXP4_9EURY|nr:hypothetical protein FK85_03065 [Halorubrum saccharovorum]
MSSDDDSDMEPPTSRVAAAATSLEAGFQRSVRLGVRVLVVATGVFFGYLVIGWGLVLVESAAAPTNFLSIRQDPVFYVLATIVGLALVQSSGSLLLYKLLTGFSTERDRFVVLFSFAALGSGGAVLRMTLPQTLGLLWAGLPL